jgi:hypothetical protein
LGAERADWTVFRRKVADSVGEIRSAVSRDQASFLIAGIAGAKQLATQPRPEPLYDRFAESGSRPRERDDW